MKKLFFVALAGLGLATIQTASAQIEAKVAITLTAYSANSKTNDNGRVTILPTALKHIETTAAILQQLAHDETVEGNLDSEVLPAGSVLNFNGSGFEIDKGTNLIVNVSDIMTWTVVGTNDIVGAGNYTDAGGPTTPPFRQTDSYLVQISYDDTGIDNKLHFIVTGLATVSVSATAPAAHTGAFTRSLTVSFVDGTGEGSASDSGPIVITGFTLTANGSAKNHLD